MTLLSICQDAADELQLTPRPQSIIGSTAPGARRLLRFANAVGKELMTEFPWQVLRKEKTFTASADELQSGILPSDFDRFVPETFYDRSGKIPLAGPIRAAQWQGLKMLGYSDRQRKFMIRGGSVYVIPAFGGNESCAFEYVSNQWCQNAAGDTQYTAWNANTDTALLDEELITRGVIYRYLENEGLPFEAAFQYYDGYKKDLRDNDEPEPNILAAGDIFTQTTSRPWTGVPETGIDFTVLSG